MKNNQTENEQEYLSNFLKNASYVSNQGYDMMVAIVDENNCIIFSSKESPKSFIKKYILNKEFNKLILDNESVNEFFNDQEKYNTASEDKESKLCNNKQQSFQEKLSEYENKIILHDNSCGCFICMKKNYLEENEEIKKHSIIRKIDDLIKRNLDSYRKIKSNSRDIIENNKRINILPGAKKYLDSQDLFNNSTGLRNKIQFSQTNKNYSEPSSEKKVEIQKEHECKRLTKKESDQYYDFISESNEKESIIKNILRKKVDKLNQKNNKLLKKKINRNKSE